MDHGKLADLSKISYVPAQSGTIRSANQNNAAFQARAIYRQVSAENLLLPDGSLKVKKVFNPDEDALVIVCGHCKSLFSDAKLFAEHKAREFQAGKLNNCFDLNQATEILGAQLSLVPNKNPTANMSVVAKPAPISDLETEEVEIEEESQDELARMKQHHGGNNEMTSQAMHGDLEQKTSWLSHAEQQSLRNAMSFQEKLSSTTPTRATEDPDDWFTEEEREHIPSLLGLGEYIGPGSSWKTPIALKPGTGIVLSGKFLPVGSSRYDKHFSFGLDLWDMTLPFSASKTRQRALYINPVFATNEIQIGSLIDEEFVGVRHVAEGEKFPFRPGGKFTFALLCRDKGFKIWWKGSRGEGGTIYNYQYDVEKIKYLRVYDCHAIYIALGFRFWNS